MIKINGVVIKTPQSCPIGIDDIGPPPERNARGSALIDRVATKRKLELSWGALSNAECSAILTAVKSVFFTVEYPDPETGAEKLIVCSASDKSAPMLKYTGTTPYWEGLQMILLER